MGGTRVFLFENSFKIKSTISVFCIRIIYDLPLRPCHVIAGGELLLEFVLGKVSPSH